MSPSRKRRPSERDMDLGRSSSSKKLSSRAHERKDTSSYDGDYVLHTPRKPLHASPRRHSTSTKYSSDRTQSSSRRSSATNPWRPATREYPPSVIGLHHEICDFYDYITPSAAEMKMRKNVVDRVTRIILKRYPHSIVKCFGSYQTELFLPSADIDMVVFGKWAQLPMHTLRAEMINQDFCSPDDAKILDKTSVPILKVTDRWTRVKVDIGFNMVNGINTAVWMKEQTDLHPCLPKLILVLKQFMQQRNLNEVFTGGISSYSLILLVVSFLQRHPRYRSTDSHPNLGVLLIEFFELYGRNFNYDQVAIRVMDGGSYILKSEMANMTSATGKRNQTGMLSIEDPLQVGHDIAKFSYGVHDVRTAFDHAYARLTKELLSEEPSESILGSVIRVHFDVLKYRRWCKSEYT